MASSDSASLKLMGARLRLSDNREPEPGMVIGT